MDREITKSIRSRELLIMRTLIYTCADKKYSHWIPLYCLAMLSNNKDIDIEIGMEGTLDDNERTCIKYLREQYPQSRIVITENLFTVHNNRANFNGSDMLINTVRFLSVPTIHDEYVYIGDIDILCMDTDITKQHISHMNECGCRYSNILRPTEKSRMTGLHFSEYDAYYPIPSVDGINLLGNDEQILRILVERKGLHIDENTLFRPVHGIHFSKNRPTVDGDGKLPGWGAEKYRKEWERFSNTEQYKFVYENTDESIKAMIEMLNAYYKRS